MKLAIAHNLGLIPSLILFTCLHCHAQTNLLNRTSSRTDTGHVFNEMTPSQPFAHWGALKKDTASKEEVIANRRMMVSVRGSDSCLRFIIFGFSIKFITDQFQEYQKEIRLQGYELTEAAASMIAKLTHGDKLVFDKILVEARDARVREISGFTIVIK